MSKATKQTQAALRERAGIMADATDYRKRADECVAMAQTARTRTQRTMLMHIAETWERLAKDSEERIELNVAPVKPRRLSTMM